LALDSCQCSEFGPGSSRILDLNDTQAGVVSHYFQHCDDNKMPLLDLKDLKKVINYITEEGKDEITSEYGILHHDWEILRKIIELEQQG
jgi:hypothetical protein